MSLGSIGSVVLPPPMDIQIALKMLEDALAENRRLKDTIAFLEGKLKSKKQNLKPEVRKARTARMKDRWTPGGRFFHRSKVYSLFNDGEILEYHHDYPDAPLTDRAIELGVGKTAQTKKKR